MSAMSENDLSKLLEDVRNYLDITWDDPKGDEKLQGMIKRGMASLAGKIGECDFLGDTQERTLLFQLRKSRRFFCNLANSEWFQFSDPFAILFYRRF